MKPFTITLFLFGFFSTAVFAQTEEESTNTANDSAEIVITPKKGEDSTIVKVAGMKIIILNDNKNNNEIIVDNELGNDSDSTSTNDEKSDHKVSHWAGIRIGVNGYLANNGLPIPSSHDFLELDYAKNVSWDLNLIEHDIRLYKNNIELVTGLGLHFASYSFKSKFATLSNTDPLSVSIDSTITLEKNRLKATYITAPLMLGFSTNQDEDKAFRLAFGGQVSWRMGSRLKQRYTTNGEINKPKVKSDYGLNPFLFHATASVGYGPVNVYANYGLNSLFESGKTIDITPFDMGLQFMF